MMGTGILDWLFGTDPAPSPRRLDVTQSAPPGTVIPWPAGRPFPPPPGSLVIKDCRRAPATIPAIRLAGPATNHKTRMGRLTARRKERAR